MMNTIIANIKHTISFLQFLSTIFRLGNKIIELNTFNTHDT